MTIPRFDPNTIFTGGDQTIVNDLAASAVLKPGHLVERFNNAGVIRWRVATVNLDGPAAEALDHPMANKGVDDTYAIGDLVEVGLGHKGAAYWMLIASGQNVAAGDLLGSAGDGTLKTGATVARFTALENKPTVLVLTRTGSCRLGLAKEPQRKWDTAGSRRDNRRIRSATSSGAASRRRDGGIPLCAVHPRDDRATGGSCVPCVQAAAGFHTLHRAEGATNRQPSSKWDSSACRWQPYRAFLAPVHADRPAVGHAVGVVYEEPHGCGVPHDAAGQPNGEQAADHAALPAADLPDPRRIPTRHPHAQNVATRRHAA
jgi:hypothetical protein